MNFEQMSYMLRPGIIESNFHTMKPRVTSEKLMPIICEVFEVTEDQIKGRSRKPKYVDARNAFSFLMFMNGAKETWQKLGDIINRKHCSVYQQYVRAQTFIQIDKQFRMKIDRCKQMIEA